MCSYQRCRHSRLPLVVARKQSPSSFTVAALIGILALSSTNLVAMCFILTYHDAKPVYHHHPPSSMEAAAVAAKLSHYVSTKTNAASLTTLHVSSSTKSLVVGPTQRQAETPLDRWFEDAAALGSVPLSSMPPQSSSSSNTVPSGQNQIPVVERVAKAIHEESLPWIISTILPILASFSLHSTLPISWALSSELTFLIYCSVKVIFTFNKPTKPQPMIGDRPWDYVRDSVWSSHPDLESRRAFLMGWFFDADFEELRREDALCFLSWKRYGLPIEGNHLSQEKIEALYAEDLVRLEHEVNNGQPLPRRKDGEKALGCMRFNCEPLRYRHKPLLFYWITHGAFHILDHALKNEYGFKYTPASDPKQDIGYWHRAPSCSSSEANPPLVFVHGVGGLSFYYPMLSQLVEEMTKNGDKTPIILLDLPQVSLRINDDIPSIASSVESVKGILDDKCGSACKATFVGHSFGSILLSWMVQSAPERVSNCVFLDPVCFQLHQKDILFNFHMKRVDHNRKGVWDNPFSLGSLINLAGTEMHTNYSMLRHFWWASNALWPSEIVNKDISACVLVSEKDEIVPSLDVMQLFDAFNGSQQEKRRDNSAWDEVMSHLGGRSHAPFVKAQVLEDSSHGGFIFEEEKRQKVIRTISAMHRINAIEYQRSHKNNELLFHTTFTPEIHNIPAYFGELWPFMTS